MSSKTETVAAQPGGPVIDILMYHSISDAGGPTSIPAPVFRDQMEAIAEAGIPVIMLGDLEAARAGRRALAPQSVIITFDDGFEDFIRNAWPVLEEKGFASITYLPTGCVGGMENWRGAHEPPRRLLDWAQVCELDAAGVDFGSHTISHPNLNGLRTLALVEELRISKQALEDRLGKEVRHFAPPYGLANHPTRSTIEKLYATSVGTKFKRATLESYIGDLPRLEMFYYTNPWRWHDHLLGRGRRYMRRRQILRQFREAMSKPWERV